MLPSLFCVLALAPIYWFLVPERLRKDFILVGSLIGLGIYDWRLVCALVLLVGLLYGAIRQLARTEKPRRIYIVLPAFALLFGLFATNKMSLSDALSGPLETQGGLVFLGVSYFVLKATAVLVDAKRGSLVDPSYFALLRWMSFLPIYPSGPIEPFKHFDEQDPRVDRDRVGRGFERILFGCFRALVLSSALATWSQPILADPSGHEPVVLLLAVYAFNLRIYLDFAGYSDIAIGLAAVYGYEVKENFDNPLIRRNLVAFWQHWHMTLTQWMRTYLFTPFTRTVMRKGGPRWDDPAIIAGQIITMVAVGLWHGLAIEFALWGFLNALGLIWVGLLAPRLGSRLPTGLLTWWRDSRLGYGISVLITLNTFSFFTLTCAMPIQDLGGYLAAMLGLR